MEQDITIWEPQINRAVSAAGRMLTEEQREDCKQECYLEILEKWSLVENITLQGKDAANKYVYRLSHNRCIEMMRALQREKVVMTVASDLRSYNADLVGNKLHAGNPVRDHEVEDQYLDGVDGKACQELYRIADFGVSNADLELAINSLPLDEQVILRAIFYDNSSIREICRSFGRPRSEKWVLGRKQSGLNGLRDFLANRKGRV